MMQCRVALIACSNGYGHVRRLLILAQALKLRCVETVLFAPSASVKRLVTLGVVSDVPLLVDFDSHTAVSNWQNGTAVDWYKNLPNISQFDIVVSDNLIEILKIRPDAWLSGSFFWHESLSGFSRDLREKSRNLLKREIPRMLSSKLFSSKVLSEYTRLYEVGLYVNQNNGVPDIHEKKDALIACGRGGEVVDVARKFVKKLANNKDIPFQKVWVDPIVFPVDPPEWMVLATFTNDMYQSILAAIIRPGVGTVTEALAVGARIFSFYEEDNFEMRESSNNLANAGVGSDLKSTSEAWNCAVEYFDDNYMQDKHLRALKKIHLDGAEEATNILLQESL